MAGSSLLLLILRVESAGPYVPSTPAPPLLLVMCGLGSEASCALLLSGAEGP